MLVVYGHFCINYTTYLNIHEMGGGDEKEKTFMTSAH